MLREVLQVDDAEPRASVRQLLGLGTWVAFILNMGHRVLPLSSTKTSVRPACGGSLNVSIVLGGK